MTELNCHLFSQIACFFAFCNPWRRRSIVSDRQCEGYDSSVPTAVHGVDIRMAGVQFTPTLRNAERWFSRGLKRRHVRTDRSRRLVTR